MKEGASLVEMIGYHIRNVGIWTGPTEQGIRWQAKIIICCFLVNLITQFIALFMATNDIEKLFECFSVLSFCSMAAFKLRSLQCKGESWRSLMSQIAALENEKIYNKSINQDSGLETIRSDDYIESYTKRFKSISTILLRLYYTTLVIFILSPFIEYGYYKMQGNAVGYPHVLPGWAPLDQLSMLGYLFTILTETISSLYCVVVHSAFDITAVGIMIFISGQFSLLRDYSERIGGNGNTFQISNGRDDLAHFRIVECHVTLNKLISAMKELDRLMRNILGVYFLLATLTLCSVAVRLNTESLSAMQIVSLLQYMGATVTQLFLFCHYGDAVLHDSSVGSGEGPYAASVWCLGPRTRRELAMLALGMTQRRRLRAGPFISLDLPSFIQVLRAAYSSYAVFRK